MAQFERSGYLQKRGASAISGFKLRWFVLDGKELRYYKKKDQSEQTGTIDVGKIMSVHPSGDISGLPRKLWGSGFVIDTGEREYQLVGKDTQDMNDWVAILDNAREYHTTFTGADSGDVKVEDFVEEEEESPSSPVMGSSMPRMEGVLLKKGASNFDRWRERWFVLEGDRLVYGVRKGAGEQQGYILLAHIEKIQPADDNKAYAGHGFNIVTRRRTYQLLAKTAGDRRRWISRLEAARKAIEKRNMRGSARSPDEEVFLEGYLLKRGRSGMTGYKDRFFLLANRNLTWYKSHTDSDPLNSVHVKEITALTQLDDMPGDVPKKNIGCGFMLQYNWPNEPEGRTMHLLASNFDDLHRWLNGLEHVRKQVHIAKQPVSAAPYSPLPEQMSGYLMKRGRSATSTYRHRWFRVEGDLLNYYMSNDNLDSSLPQGSIPLREATYIHAHPDMANTPKKYAGCGFLIDTEHRVYYLLAPSKAEVDEWVSGLEKHRLKYAKKENITPILPAGQPTGAAAINEAAKAAADNKGKGKDDDKKDREGIFSSDSDSEIDEMAEVMFWGL